MPVITLRFIPAFVADMTKAGMERSEMTAYYSPAKADDASPGSSRPTDANGLSAVLLSRMGQVRTSGT